MHAVRVGGIELAVVELEIVVQDRGPLRRRQGALEQVGDLQHDRVGVSTGDGVPPAAPAPHLAGDEAVRPAKVRQAAAGVIDLVQVGERADDSEPNAPGDVCVVAHRLRD